MPFDSSGLICFIRRDEDQFLHDDEVSLFRNKRLKMLDEMLQRNTSKFAIFTKIHVVFLVFIFSLMNALLVDIGQGPGHSLRDK